MAFEDLIASDPVAPDPGGQGGLLLPGLPYLKKKYRPYVGTLEGLSSVSLGEGEEVLPFLYNEPVYPEYNPIVQSGALAEALRARDAARIQDAKRIAVESEDRAKKLSSGLLMRSLPHAFASLVTGLNIRNDELPQLREMVREAERMAWEANQNAGSLAATLPSATNLGLAQAADQLDLQNQQGYNTWLAGKADSQNRAAEARTKAVSGALSAPLEFAKLDEDQREGARKADAEIEKLRADANEANARAKYYNAGGSSGFGGGSGLEGPVATALTNYNAALGTLESRMGTLSQLYSRAASRPLKTGLFGKPIPGKYDEDPELELGIKAMIPGILASIQDSITRTHVLSGASEARGIPVDMNPAVLEALELMQSAFLPLRDTDEVTVDMFLGAVKKLEGNPMFAEILGGTGAAAPVAPQGGGDLSVEDLVSQWDTQPTAQPMPTQAAPARADTTAKHNATKPQTTAPAAPRVFASKDMTSLEFSNAVKAELRAAAAEGRVPSVDVQFDDMQVRTLEGEAASRAEEVRNRYNQVMRWNAARSNFSAVANSIKSLTGKTITLADIPAEEGAYIVPSVSRNTSDGYKAVITMGGKIIELPADSEAAATQRAQRVAQLLITLQEAKRGGFKL